MDGGLDIPHSEKRFAGFDKETKQLDPEVHRKYIFGGHVAAYMRVSAKFFFVLFFLLEIDIFFLHAQTLAEDEPERYQSHFSEYLKRGLEADNLEELYKKVHAAIRADPTPKKSEKAPPKEHKRLVWWEVFFSPL